MNIHHTGQMIASLRKAQGLTQASLAEKLGISDKAVSKWERGIASPDIGLWNRLSIILETDMESLIYDCDEVEDWEGVLILDSHIDPMVTIYDKPLIHYLLSQFFLAGIRNISIVGDCEQISFPGTEIQVIKDRHLNQRFTKNTMAIYGNYFICGSDLTRHYRRAMTRRDAPTFICTTSRKGLKAIGINSDKKIGSPTPGSNAYFAEPMVFFPDGTEFTSSLSKALQIAELNAELLFRGMASFHIDSYDEASALSDYIRIMQHSTGEMVACIPEILIRRGIVNYKDIEIEDFDSDTMDYIEKTFRKKVN